MSQLITYLTFNGNCREAMLFYQSCLGGELYFQTLEESPKAKNLPNNYKKYILQAILKKENIVLMGTDLFDEDRLLQGNTIAILLKSNDETKIRKYYSSFSKKKTVSLPLKRNYWGILYGSITDTYGIRWLFSCNN
ncbi:VOC family protein [Tenacibaculum singaporense]|uniref:VOC family protein n=1 Tax=Tenacibaculum singaporense TaxID=2358479 RepID=A0A3Q8RPX7_9FLAO|nr:VOC family protein [Tenacibaculum singaporense]AZJ36687.1 VOC family protein [Tenacibaculum singaporense]